MLLLPILAGKLHNLLKLFWSCCMKTVCHLLVICCLLAFFCFSCSGDSAYEYDLTIGNPAEQACSDVEVRDIDGDGREEIIAVLSHANQPRIYIFYYDSAAFITYEQINTINTGRLYTRNDSADRLHFGLISVEDFKLIAREYLLDGEMVNEWLLIDFIPDLNQNEMWDGAVQKTEIIDYNDDGEEDIFIYLGATYDEQPRAFLIVDGATGELLNQIDFGMCLSQRNVHLLDIDDDQQLEILFISTACSNEVDVNGFSDEICYLGALELDGSRIWVKEMGGRYATGRSDAPADIDGDGDFEFVCFLSHRGEMPSAGDSLFVVDPATGSFERRIDLSEQLLDFPVLLDRDHDGKMEICVRSTDGNLHLFDHTLKRIQSSTGGTFKDIHLQDLLPAFKDNSQHLLASSRNRLITINDELAISGAMELPYNLNADFKAFEMLGSNSGERETFIFADRAGIPLLHLKASRTLASIGDDYSQPALILLAIAALVVTVFWLRNRSLLQQEKFKVQLLLSEGSAGGNTIFINNNLLIESISPEALRLLAAESDQPAMVRLEELTELHDVISNLKNSSMLQLAKKKIRLGDEGAPPVDLLARKLLDSHGNPYGYLVNVNQDAPDNLEVRAAESVHIGQELMHKIKTLISIYHNDLSILEKRLEEAEWADSAMIIREMKQVSDQIVEISKSYLQLSRLVQSSSETIRLPDVLQEAAAMVQNEGKRIGFDFKFDPEAAVFLADSEQLNNLFINIFENSIKAMQGEGSISVRTELLRRLGSSPGGKLEEYISISIVDDGPGIGQANAEKLFHPGYSDFSGGAGLGLSICKRIVELHDGEISIEDLNGRGTEVRILLPLRKASND